VPGERRIHPAWELGQATVHIPDSWEEIADMDDDCPKPVVTRIVATLAPKDIFRKKKNDMQYDLKEKDTPHVIYTEHGHGYLAASRAALYDNILRDGIRALTRKPNHYGNRPVIFDIGSGANGIRRAYFTKRYTDAIPLYVHCMATMADEQDVFRIESIYGKFRESLHYVGNGAAPIKDLVNYCHHSAATCTCFGLYTHVFAFSVHACYYFNASDWLNLHKQIGVFGLTIGTHIPIKGRMVPHHDPEFQWQDVPYHEIESAANEARLDLGLDPLIRFTPLKTHGTRYIHPNQAWLARGGIHLTPQFKRAEELCTLIGDRPVYQWMRYAVRAVGFALGSLAGYVATRRWGSKASLAVFLCSLPLKYVEDHGLSWWYRVRSVVPYGTLCHPNTPTRADVAATVRVVPQRRYTTDHGEEICHAYTIQFIEGYAPLEPRLIDTPPVDQNAAREGAVMLAMCTGSARTTESRVMALYANMRRRFNMTNQQAIESAKVAMNQENEARAVLLSHSTACAELRLTHALIGGRDYALAWATTRNWLRSMLSTLTKLTLYVIALDWLLSLMVTDLLSGTESSWLVSCGGWLTRLPLALRMHIMHCATGICAVLRSPLTAIRHSVQGYSTSSLQHLQPVMPPILHLEALMAGALPGAPQN
jgi:hypothetical protein